MCGIAGVVDFDGRSFATRLVADMARKLEHRGPDGEGAVVLTPRGTLERLEVLEASAIPPSAGEAVAALAHRRLAIIDLSNAGAQPMPSEDGRWWITYNGEIYNYIELRETLKGLGHAFRSASDTEVILHAYAQWGADCLRHLNGMFAFAIFDTATRSLFCARDPLGIKPFYYCLRDRRLFFASEPKALHAALGGHPAPNLEAVADYLTFSYVPGAATMFQGIQRLLPGTYALADGNGLKVGTYWDPKFEPSEPARSVDDLGAELRALIDDAIRMQIRSDVPVGAHLSGGIDSSTVCCIAARHLPKLHTFTARFAEGGFYDESPYARHVAEHVHSEHREITPKGAALTELLPRIVYHLDEPVEAASVFGKFHVAEIVSDSVTVVLGGQGGDELFGGYDWYVKNLFTGMAYGARPFTSPAAGREFMLAAVRREGKKRLAKSLWKNFGESDIDKIFCSNWSRLSSPQLRNLFNADAAAQWQLLPEQRFLRGLERLDALRPADRMFKFDMQNYLEALLTSEDRLSMAHSIESRVPLLDHRIAELASRIGFEQKAVPGRSKIVLRKAVEGIVPAKILNRTDKRGFPTPIGQWLRDGDLKLAERFIFSGNRFAETYFNMDSLRALDRDRSYFSTDATERLWRVLNVCVWASVFDVR